MVEDSVTDETVDFDAAASSLAGYGGRYRRWAGVFQPVTSARLKDRRSSGKYWPLLRAGLTPELSNDSLA